MLFFAALLVPASSAQAASSVLCTGYSSCTSKGYSHGGYESHKGKSYWNMYTGTNCTNYVAYRLVSTNGMPNKRPKAGVGNARDWGTAMASVTDSKPTVGSVAWWGRTGNHVAYVEKVVSSTEIIVSESNWSGAFDWRRITKSGSGWPDGFIHFSDPETTITNKSKPSIDGSPQVGTSIRALIGSWSPSGNTHSYQWFADGKAISGATAKTFTPGAEVLDKDLTVSVKASQPGLEAATAVSAARQISPGAFDKTALPVVTGPARVGSTLTASTGTWTPAASRHTYQWLVDRTEIAGATSPTFVPGPELAGRSVTVRVRATRAGYDPRAATSEPTAEITRGALTSTALPVISGTPRVGSPLTSSTGGWSRDDVTHTYRWSVDGVTVDGATEPTYVPRPEDVDKTVRVRVAAASEGYTGASATSAATAVVAPGRIVTTTPPSVTGTVRVGTTMAVAPGVHTPPDATVRYQWLRDGKALSGTTGPSHVVTATDLGKRFAVTATLKAPGYTTTTITTSETRTAKAAATLSGSVTKPGKGAATFALRVSAPDGPAPTGKITITYVSGRTKTFAVKDGRATIAVTGQAAGKRTFSFSYSGSSKTGSASWVRTVTIR